MQQNNQRITQPKMKQPVKAIRAFCVECQGGPEVPGISNLIKNCPASSCPLYEFRFGENPSALKNKTL